MADENIALSYSLSSLPRGKDQAYSINHNCNVTSTHVGVDINANVFVCKCVAWLPIPVGKVDDFDSLEGIWHSPQARVLQADIADKKFTWCAVDHCGIKHRDINQQSYSLTISIDDSCNLACPSCRREQIMLEDGSEFEIKKHNIHKIVSWLEKFDKPILITMSGNGDPLASRIIRPLIQNYYPKANQYFNLKTNGLLLKKILEHSPIKKSIAVYSVSVDAGSATTYEQVRRPGKWSVLLDNLQWLSQHRESAEVVLDFVVQASNLEDIRPFVELCAKHKFRANFSALFDWGTWNATKVDTPDPWTIQNGTFVDHNVADISHPLHDKFVKILNDVHSADLPYVTLAPFFKQFIHVPR